MKFILALVLSMVSFAALADDTPVTPTTALPLNMGNWEVAGSATYTRNVRSNQRYLSIMPHAEYFFANRFSAGGTVQYTDDNVFGTTWGIGPSATYYITHTERWALSIDQSILWSNSVSAVGSRSISGGNYVQGATGLAFDFFLTPSIAFGPALRAYYYFNGGVDKPDDAVQLAFNFSLFL